MGLDMIALAHDEGVTVDAWTHAMAEPDAGFSDAEWVEFSDLVALKPDQITTDSPLATEAAFLQREPQ
jgi:glycerophosphoryl diester phosphodiesterase